MLLPERSAMSRRGKKNKNKNDNKEKAISKSKSKGGHKQRRERREKRKQVAEDDENNKSRKVQRKEVYDIKIAQLNAGRLTSTKLTFLEEAVSEHQVDVICLQEVKKRTDPGDRNIKLDGFDGPHRCECTRERADPNEVATCMGLAMYFRKTSTLTKTTPESHTTPEGVHYQSCKMSTNGTKEITLYNVYRTPSINNFGFTLPGATTPPSGNVLIVGDFNVRASWLGYQKHNPTVQAGLESFLEDNELTCLQSCSSPTTLHNIYVFICFLLFLIYNTLLYIIHIITLPFLYICYLIIRPSWTHLRRGPPSTINKWPSLIIRPSWTHLRRGPPSTKE